MEYILGDKPDGCVLCVPDSRDEDEKRLVVWRGTGMIVMLNRYPYASGHLMVIPRRHAHDVTDLTPEECAEMMATVQLCCRVLREVSRPEGINVGLNLGKAAGAGIRDHVHMHVVPRWNGDSSFVAVLDEVRVIPEHLARTYQRFAPVFAALGGAN